MPAVIPAIGIDRATTANAVPSSVRVRMMIPFI
jgi:hypothetical protein